MQTFVAADRQSGITVLAALREWLPGTTWSAVRKLMSARRVLVNDALCLDEARRLKPGEVVRLADRPHEPPPVASDVRIVWLDDEIVVVDKPAGMTTLRHAAERGWSDRKKRKQPALDDVLPELIARAAGSRGARRTAFSVHRIDRDTSGLLVFARTPGAQHGLIRQFKRHSVERVYLALAHGSVEGRTMDTYLVDDRGDGRRGSSADREHGRRAVTHVMPIERIADLTLIECRLETGRTHQIRIHLSDAGHPIAGDFKYGRTDERIGRLCLHAAVLGFEHPADGRDLRFESPLPADLASTIERLRMAQ